MELLKKLTHRHTTPTCHDSTGELIIKFRRRFLSGFYQARFGFVTSFQDFWKLDLCSQPIEALLVGGVDAHLDAVEGHGAALVDLACLESQEA